MTRLAKGEKIFVTYDATPLRYSDGAPIKHTYEAVVTKVTPGGLYRIETLEKNEDGEPKYNELFYPIEMGLARGWNTLWWHK